MPDFDSTHTQLECAADSRDSSRLSFCGYAPVYEFEKHYKEHVEEFRRRLREVFKAPAKEDEDSPDICECPDETICGCFSGGEQPMQQLPIVNGYRVAGLGLAQRAEQIQLGALARGGSLEYAEAARLARDEFQASGADPNRPLSELRAFAEATPPVKTTMSESKLPRSKDGRYALTGMGTAQRMEGLQAAAARDGKKLSFSDARQVVRAFEQRTGAHPDAPLSFAEQQAQVRAMRAE